jgi:hypothetical protein
MKTPSLGNMLLSQCYWAGKYVSLGRFHLAVHFLSGLIEGFERIYSSKVGFNEFRQPVLQWCQLSDSGFMLFYVYSYQNAKLSF